MLMNNLDPDVAERPDDLVVYGGTGRAARSWDAFDAMVRTLTTLADDETMLVQSGKPVGVFRTHEWAPRVLLANSNLVPEWGNWDEFRRLEQLGLTMYGQMTAGSWIYIGTQGILQGTYECFAEIARRRFGGTLAGTITLTAGLGGMGGAQPLAVTMNDGVALCIDIDATRVHRRVETRYLDEVADSLEDAVARCEKAAREKRPLSVGVVGPSALGEFTQNAWHDVIHVPHANGWANQLHDEPGLQLSWERRYRTWQWAESTGSQLGVDASGFPNCMAHFERIKNRPSVQKLLDYEKSVQAEFAKAA